MTTSNEFKPGQAVEWKEGDTVEVKLHDGKWERGYYSDPDGDGHQVIVFFPIGKHVAGIRAHKSYYPASHIRHPAPRDLLDAEPWRREMLETPREGMEFVLNCQDGSTEAFRYWDGDCGYSKGTVTWRLNGECELDIAHELLRHSPNLRMVSMGEPKRRDKVQIGDIGVISVDGVRRGIKLGERCVYVLAAYADNEPIDRREEPILCATQEGANRLYQMAFTHGGYEPATAEQHDPREG